MKKINALILLIATIGIASLTSFASTSYEPVHGFHFYYGSGFGSFGGGMGMGSVGFGMDFGPFNHFASFGGGFGGFGSGFGPGMLPVSWDAFGGFGNTAFDGRKHSSGHKIVPIPATASATSSITFDESGEIHIRPFDDEDLFVED